MRLLSTLALFIAAGDLVFVRQATAEPKNSQTIEVTIVNTARVPFDVLAQAQVQAAEIYESANIVLTWTSSLAPVLKQSGASVPRLIVRIHDVPQHTHTFGVFGFALPESRLAYVLYGEVVEYADKHGISPGKLLGHVLAHELGHLLLGHGRHSSAGLMRRDWTAAPELTILQTTSVPLSLSMKQSDLIRRSAAFR